jgi:polyhydroxyalkanoate synthesis regulator phasin
MKIEKNKLVNRAQVLNQDIQLGIIAYSVAEMASIIEQTNAKLNKGEINDEQHKAIVDDCVEYIKSAKEVCDESKMDWSVCILLSRTNLDKYVESKVD